MAEDWELKSLVRRMDSLEEKWSEAEKRRREAEEEQRRRRDLWLERIWLTCIVAIVAVTITLSVTHNLHHH